jgi:hypothetical protein
MKRLDLSAAWKLEKAKQLAQGLLKLLTVLVVVDDMNWNSSSSRDIKGKVVPLNVAVEFFVARNLAQQIHEMSINPAHLWQLRTLVHLLAPCGKASAVVRVCFQPSTFLFAQSVVLKMVACDHVVQGMSEHMDCFCNEGLVVSHFLLDQLSRFISNGACTGATRYFERSRRFDVILWEAVGTKRMAMGLGQDVIRGKCGISVVTDLEKRALLCCVMNGNTGFVLDVTLQGIVRCGSRVGRLASQVQSVTCSTVEIESRIRKFELTLQGQRLALQKYSIDSSVLTYLLGNDMSQTILGRGSVFSLTVDTNKS